MPVRDLLSSILEVELFVTLPPGTRRVLKIARDAKTIFRTCIWTAPRANHGRQSWGNPESRQHVSFNAWS